MKLQDFYCDLPAIWLVFAGSYLNHENAPVTSLDQREKSLVDLLLCYLQGELESSANAVEPYNEHITTQLTTLTELLELWSEDLNIIYQIRQHSNKYLKATELAQRFLQRIQNFENCTIIPNGLISAKHNKKNENISLAILKKNKNTIDWIQIDPGSAYHQRCQGLTGEKSNAYLEIRGINLKDINKDWLSLLVGLKAIDPNGYYKDVSLYECLLAHLNGETVFKSQPDEAFIFYTHTSPIHTWHVVEQTFRYLLQHFLGESYFATYQQLIIGFKLFLLEQTFTAYENADNKKMPQCHYLLQEMCRDIAEHTLKQGNQKQIAAASKRIDAIKAVIEQQLIQQYQQTYNAGKLDELEISSLNFTTPAIANHTVHSNNSEFSNLQSTPLFIKPTIDDDIIDYIYSIH